MVAAPDDPDADDALRLGALLDLDRLASVQIGARAVFD